MYANDWRGRKELNFANLLRLEKEELCISTKHDSKQDKKGNVIKLAYEPVKKRSIDEADRLGWQGKLSKLGIICFFKRRVSFSLSRIQREKFIYVAWWVTVQGDWGQKENSQAGDKKIVASGEHIVYPKIYCKLGRWFRKAWHWRWRSAWIADFSWWRRLLLRTIWQNPAILWLIFKGKVDLSAILQKTIIYRVVNLISKSRRLK